MANWWFTMLCSKKGFDVRSYGTGSMVKLPGAGPNEPNVYEFGTTYEHIYQDLCLKDQQLYPFVSSWMLVQRLLCGNDCGPHVPPLVCESLRCTEDWKRRCWYFEWWVQWTLTLQLITMTSLAIIEHAHCVFCLLQRSRFSRVGVSFDRHRAGRSREASSYCS